MSWDLRQSEICTEFISVYGNENNNIFSRLWLIDSDKSRNFPELIFCNLRIPKCINSDIKILVIKKFYIQVSNYFNVN